MKKILLVSTLGIIVLLMILALRPINVSSNNCITVNGTVTAVTEGGTKDAIIHLSAHTNVYYINRGLETAFTLQTLKDKLVGNTVAVTYAKHWSPLDPLQRNRHITELSMNGQLLYTTLKK